MNTKSFYHKNFNLIRLLAALQVLLVHACNHFQYKAWFVDAIKIVPGVPTFFFTSGFLIFFAYERMLPADRLGFFINRFLRIYPGLLVCVLVSVVTVYLTGYFDNRHVGSLRFAGWILGQVTLFQFYNPPFMRDYGVGVLNGALWTITVEMQFYFLVPLLYYLLKSRPAVLVLVSAVSVAVNVAANLALREPANWDLMSMKLLMVSFAPYVYMFILGFVLASTDRIRVFASELDWRYLGLLAVAYVLSMNFIGPYAANASNSINPLSFLILALIVMQVSKATLPLPAALQRFLERTDFSYGLYLYHMPIINLLLVVSLWSAPANIAILLLCGLLAAVASWYLIEKPALSRKRRHTGQVPWQAAAKTG